MPDAPQTETRPCIDADISGKEFERWYWPVEDLKKFCEILNLSKSGTKAELRTRVAFELTHPGQMPTREPRIPKPGSFKWSTANLSKDTVITEDVSFGPNLRGFFKAEIGKAFVCHSDFMDWVRNNVGASLGDAIEAWKVLEDRKQDPEFRREIASCNNYLQYLRDARDRHPDLSLDAAKACWDYKKIRPAQNGRVVFEDADIQRANAHP
ncbi:MAG: DUF6434 domain-containing protein [Pseudomonadota bacterium]